MVRPNNNNLPHKDYFNSWVESFHVMSLVITSDYQKSRQSKPFFPPDKMTALRNAMKDKYSVRMKKSKYSEKRPLC